MDRRILLLATGCRQLEELMKRAQIRPLVVVGVMDDVLLQELGSEGREGVPPVTVYLYETG